METSIYQYWINEGSKYSTGVQFYLQHGNNDTLKALFKKGESFYTAKKLAYEMANFKNIALQVRQDLPSYPKTFRQPTNKINFEKLPDSLKSEYVKLGPLIGKIRYFHAKLTDAQTDETRKQYAFEIVEATEQRRAIFNALDHYTQHGTLLTATQPPTPTAINIDQAEELKIFKLQAELRLLRSQRSKLKKKPNRIKDYNTVIERITQIETQIK